MHYGVLPLCLRLSGDTDRDHLLKALQGKTTLVLGPSGAGKSTLINLLVPGALAETNEISQALNSGKHTTTSTTWYWVDEARTTALIDSPGFQEFGLNHIDPMQPGPADARPEAPHRALQVLQLQPPARTRLRRDGPGQNSPWPFMKSARGATKSIATCLPSCRSPQRY
jgi:energy-coupling factor transporter ATP-binding protein EcfA2